VKTIDASKLRQKLAGVLESVRDGRQKVVIVRYGQPIAALVPIKDLSAKERRGLGAHRRGGDSPGDASK
jgi:prevent-host-death family protein